MHFPKGNFHQCLCHNNPNNTDSSSVLRDIFCLKRYCFIPRETNRRNTLFASENIYTAHVWKECVHYVCVSPLHQDIWLKSAQLLEAWIIFIQPLVDLKCFQTSYESKTSGNIWEADGLWCVWDGVSSEEGNQPLISSPSGVISVAGNAGKEGSWTREGTEQQTSHAWSPGIKSVKTMKLR